MTIPLIAKDLFRNKANIKLSTGHEQVLSKGKPYVTIKTTGYDIKVKK